MRQHIKVRFVIAFCMVISVSAVSPAQSGRVRGETRSLPDDDKPALKLRAEEVLLPVSVRSDNGRIPSYLERSDFIVSEDGKRQQITSVLQTPASDDLHAFLFRCDLSARYVPSA